MDFDIAKFTKFGKEFGLEGKELKEFVLQERTKFEKERDTIQKGKESIEREARAHQLEMRRQEQVLLKIQVKLETARKESAVAVSSNPNVLKQGNAPKLPFYEDKDDMDAYLQRFERYANSMGWKKEVWALNLGALLKGKALEVYSRLSFEEAGNYDILKDALLKCYQLSEQGFRINFRTAVPCVGETPSQFICRLDNLLTRWIELAKTEKTFPGLKDLLLREQFINSCNKDAAIFLKERKPSNINKMGELAEQYSEAHNGYFGAPRTSSGNGNRCPNVNDRRTPPMVPTRNPNRTDQTKFQPNQRPKTVCQICKRLGHSASDCWFRNKTFEKSAGMTEDQNQHKTKQGSKNSDCECKCNPKSSQTRQSDNSRDKPYSTSTSHEKIACL